MHCFEELKFNLVLYYILQFVKFVLYNNKKLNRLSWKIYLLNTHELLPEIKLQNCVPNITKFINPLFLLKLLEFLEIYIDLFFLHIFFILSKTIIICLVIHIWAFRYRKIIYLVQSSSTCRCFLETVPIFLLSDLSNICRNNM